MTWIEIPVDAVHVLAHVLQHQHMPCEVRLKRRAEQLAQDGEVEGQVRMAWRPPRSSDAAAPSTSQASPRFTACSPPSADRGPTGIGPCATCREPRPVEARQQEAGVRIAQPFLPARGGAQLRDRLLRHPASRHTRRAPATPRRRSGSLADLHQRRDPLAVRRRQNARTAAKHWG